MDVVRRLTTKRTYQPVQCLDMHTTGEPTRIVLSGYPDLKGTLLEQRAQARDKHDLIRRRLILEPRGHNDMYGAVLRWETELVHSGAAHIGVLFLTNEGYSTMCGHATIALGRFLFDTGDLNVFPKRGDVTVNRDDLTAEVNLHAPCGVVRVTVPVTADGQRSDPLRAVSFVNVPSFATGVDVEVSLPLPYRWPELAGRTRVRVDVSYGGAFYCMITAAELGFPAGLRQFDFDAMNRATRLLKAALTTNPAYRVLFTHPEFEDLSFLYSVIVVDSTLPETDRSETGLCFFSDQQLDRSPTGSGVAAREALAVAKGTRAVGEKWTYHSLVSVSSSSSSAEEKEDSSSNNTGNGGVNGFDSEIIAIRPNPNPNNIDGDGKGNGNGYKYPVVDIKVSGFAFYTGVSTFVLEPEDGLGTKGGFVFEKLNVSLSQDQSISH